MKKTFMLIAMILLVALILPMALFGCDKVEDPEPTEAPTEAPTETPTEPAGTEKPTVTGNGETVVKLASNMDKVKTIGRITKLTTGLACDHIASGIEFTGVFEGDVKLRMKTTQIKNEAGCENSYFTVYVDGVRQPTRIAVSSVAKNVKIASFDKKGEHTIRVINQTENNYNINDLIELRFKGELKAPPADKDLYFEFIGDSVTCGMGNIGTNTSEHPGTSKLEDGSQCYGYIASEKLGADCSVIAQSGIGLSVSWDDPMIPFYQAASYNRDREAKYDFENARVPDVVVINLGSNDYYINNSKNDDSPHKDWAIATPAALKEKAMEFISVVRSSYGENMPIVWVSKFIGIGDKYVNAINQAIAELGGEGAGLYRLDVTQNTGGAQWHPDVSGHKKAAEELVKFIEDKEILTPKEYEVTNMVSLAINSSAVKHLGRTMVVSNGIACDHSASGIEFNGVFEGDVKVAINSTKKKAGCDNSYFTVYVDGVRQPTRFTVPEGTTTLTVASFETKGAHNIRIVKQTEANYTLSEIKFITFKGELTAPPANNDLYIEFIGDSLTCGMGNVGTNSSGPDPQTSPFEDASQSYGYLTAERLGADYVITSEAGIGISGSWFDPLFDFYKTASYKRSTTEMYDFSRKPDLIVINLGTNDYYINKDRSSAECTTAMVTEKTKEFIELVRSSYGEDIPIVWVSRFVYLSDEYVSAVEEGIRQYAVAKTSNNSATGENVGIYRLDVTQNTGGAQYHPNVSGHSTAANQLIAFIDSKNILK